MTFLEELINKRNQLAWSFFDVKLSIAEALEIDEEVQALDAEIEELQENEEAIAS